MKHVAIHKIYYDLYDAQHLAIWPCTYMDTLSELAEWTSCIYILKGIFPLKVIILHIVWWRKVLDYNCIVMIRADRREPRKILEPRA